MELDELKKTWNLMDEQLKDKQLIRDEDISLLISKAGNSINDLGRFITRGILASLIIIAYFVITSLLDHRLDWFFITLLIAAVPALGWDIHTTRYLRKTRMDEMPLVSVIARINRYYRWMIWEGIVGVIFVITIATAYFFDRGIWTFAPSMILLFFLIWGSIMGFLYWMYQKRIMNRLREIRKNLKELKELKEE